MEKAMEKEKRKIGHTCITWDESDVESAVKTLAQQGYYGVEVFGWTLEALEAAGKLDIFESYGIPLCASYFAMNLCDPGQFDSSLEKGLRWAKLMQRLGARYICMGGEDVNRKKYCFADIRKNVIEAVNKYGRYFSDMGLCVCYHPHTGTPIQTEEEIRYLVEHMDTSLVKFAPDVGQIEKGGTDAVAIVRDYLEIIRHIHVKDFDGKPLSYDETGREIDTSGFVGYTPLGEGVVKLEEVLKLVEDSEVFDNLIMVELDGGAKTPIPQEEAVRRNKEYLLRLGYQFRR